MQPILYLDAEKAWSGRSHRRCGRSSRGAASGGLDLPLQAIRDRADLLQVQYVQPPVSRAPVVSVVHDISFEDIPSALPAATRLCLAVTVRHAILTSALVVTESEFTRSRILDCYRVTGDRVVLMPCGIDDA